jgi:integrase
MKGSMTERRPGIWRLRVHAGRRDGRPHYAHRTVTGNKRAAQVALAAFVSEICGGPAGLTHDGRVTVEAFAKTWLAGKAAAVRPTTHAGYDQMVRLHIVPLLGSVPLRRLSFTMIDAAYARRLSEGYSAATVGQAHKTLQLICKSAQRAGHIQANPASLATPPRVEHKAPAMVDKAAYVAAFAGSRLEAAAVLLLSCGMRRGELLALTWQEGAQHFESGRLVITTSLIEAPRRLMLAEPKTAAGRRTILLPGGAIEALRAHRVRQLEEHLRLGLGAPTYLFTAPGKATAWRPSKFARAFSRIAAAHGLRVHPHLLRHQHCTDLLEANVHPRIVQARAGHASVQVTLSVYSHVTEMMQSHAVDAAQAVLEKARPA